MGKVVVRVKVMPEDADTDLDALEDDIEKALVDGAELSDITREDVAFGLVALLVDVMVEDEAGGTQAVEDSLSDLDDVESVSVEDVGRV
ncbi:MAG: elongation factor 1-beta [Halobacteriales archaeon]